MDIKKKDVYSSELKITKKEYHKLVEEARKHDYLYYVEAKPIISDYEYDKLIRDIEAIEKEHPDWIIPDSPTQKIASDTKSGFKEVEHTHPMLSLTNTYSEEELASFIHRMEKLLEKSGAYYNVELKMDGVAISIRYEKGRLVQAVTRGDGKKGDDVTANVKMIRNLPHKLEGHGHPPVLELRGEVFMPINVFRALNVGKEEAGEEVYANPRNAAAGSLKLLDPEEAKERKLSIVIYDMVEGAQYIEYQSDIASCLKKWGLPVYSGEYTKRCKSVKEILAFAEGIEKNRPNYPFQIDGIVVKLDHLKDRAGIGFTGRSPRWAVAYKFQPEQAITIIEEIVVQVGRTGVLTPVANLKPVKLAGSTIARATLHNQDEIDRKDIRVGDTVVIEKGGDVIPKVVSVDLSKREAHAKKWHMPKTCPSCGEKVEHREGEVAIRCMNPECKSRNLQKIIYFASKDAFDIEHLGDKVITKLVEKGLVVKPSDIFRLTEEDLEEIEGFKEKSIHNVLTSIEKAKDTTLARFIYALGIKYVGEATSELIAGACGSIKGFLTLKEEDLLDIDGIGPKASASVIEFLKKKDNQREIEELLDLGVNPKGSKKPKMNHPFSHKTFVLTGTLGEFTRSEAEKLIKERGGKVTSSVSQKTDFVLVGSEPGSKLTNAKKLGIKLLSERDFKEAL